jgi:hypothetical protein
MRAAFCFSRFWRRYSLSFVRARLFEETHPDVPIFAAAVDPEIDPSGYILPGMGDAGDRLFGTR